MGGDQPQRYTAAQVTRIREALGLTQSEFARKYGLAKSTVSQWESGRRPVSGVSASFFEPWSYTL